MTDLWKDWVLTHRSGGSENYDKALEEYFIPLREKLLDRANVKAGETLLDVGTGDGLVGFGALDRVRETGRVIFSDISEPLLTFCEAAAKHLAVQSRCEFRKMSADALTLEDQSVDVVTTRSVLIYLKDKKKCLAEFFRVLKPGGRISLFEPVADVYTSLGRGRSLYGLEMDVPEEMLRKLKAGFTLLNDDKDSTLQGFDERQMLRWADEAGFDDIEIEMQLTKRIKPSPPINYYLTTRSNPLASTLQEVLDNTMTPSERTTILAALEKSVEKGRKEYMALMYLTATKS